MLQLPLVKLFCIYIRQKVRRLYEYILTKGICKDNFKYKLTYVYMLMGPQQEQRNSPKKCTHFLHGWLKHLQRIIYTSHLCTFLKKWPIYLRKGVRHWKNDKTFCHKKDENFKKFNFPWLKRRLSISCTSIWNQTILLNAKSEFLKRKWCIMVLGLFINYIYRFLNFFDPPSPPGWQHYIEFAKFI